jgi:hypothetical protein
MRNEGTRIAQIAANIQMWSNRLRDHMLVCPGCAWSSRSPTFSIDLGQKKTSVHPSVKTMSRLSLSLNNHILPYRDHPDTTFSTQKSHIRSIHRFQDSLPQHLQTCTMGATTRTGSTRKDMAEPAENLCPDKRQSLTPAHQGHRHIRYKHRTPRGLAALANIICLPSRLATKAVAG